MTATSEAADFVLKLDLLAPASYTGMRNLVVTSSRKKGRQHVLALARAKASLVENRAFI
jgi:hypothetical protein